ncbi:hypothetical protein QUB78_25160 [Microcoleus sp. ARI1-A4]
MLNPTQTKTNIRGFLALARGYNASFRKKTRLMRQSWISGTSAILPVNLKRSATSDKSGFLYNTGKKI